MSGSVRSLSALLFAGAVIIGSVTVSSQSNVTDPAASPLPNPNPVVTNLIVGVSATKKIGRIRSRESIYALPVSLCGRCSADRQSPTGG